MKVPMKWLKDFVNIEATPRQFAEDMTMSGSKVESVEYLAEGITNVVLGKILSLEKHPDADRLQVGKVDVGSREVQIVTGADNISVGDYIPVALDGAAFPDGKTIKKGKLRGVESEGMMCSVQELGYTRYDFPDAPEHGIYLVSPTLLEYKYGKAFNHKEVLGKNICEVLGLDDHVVDFEITPNRPDCLSVVGIAREAAATFGAEFRKPQIKVNENAKKSCESAKVEILDAGLCPRYAARIIRNVKTGPSPEWMKERLRAAGVRPINNIVDITNYVMLEMGQPMHAFDLDCLKGSQIIVRRAAKGETLETLDGNSRLLDVDMLVIADSERPVAVAGVMGGGNSEISEKTTNILFESACFNGTSVRITSKKLGMRTEASSRFEKGLDVNNVVQAVDRAAQLIVELGAGEVLSGVIDCYPSKVEPKVIPLECGKINALLGTDISREEMVRILKSVELEVDDKNNRVTVPTFRMDIEEMADLAEEVARFYGYNKIIPTLLPGKEMTRGIKSEKQKREDTIKECMLASGLYEIYTYSFASPDVFDRINLPEDSDLRNAVVISNPLGEDNSIMRTTTIPDMLTVLSRNFSRRMEETRFFELSNTYSKKEKRSTLVPGIDESGLPKEYEILTLGMYGNIDFYNLKGVVEGLLKALKINDYTFKLQKNHPTFHPGRTADLYINGEKAGTLGEIHPDVLEKYEIDTKAYVGVLEVEKLIQAAGSTSQYKPLPKFPAMSRDIAMLVKEDILVKQIEDILVERSGKLLEEVKLFDVYKGKQIPDGMKSVAYSITFRAEDRTLTDEEVNKIMDKILAGLRTSLDAQLRD